MSQPDSPKRETMTKNEAKNLAKPEIRRSKVHFSISTTVIGVAKPEELSKGVAYIFSKGGALLGKANLNPQGHAEVDINLPVTETTQQLQILVGPEIKENISISELLRLGSEQSYTEVTPKTTEKELAIKLTPRQILCWLLSRCIVDGIVLKKIVSGGIAMDLPVCNATVEVYEVDPIYVLIPKLPIEIIERIREFLVKPPPPPPPPIREKYADLFTMGPIPPRPITIGNQPAKGSVYTTDNSHNSIATIQLISLKAPSAEENPTLNLFSDTEIQKLRLIAQTTSTEQFRQALINNAYIVKNILCLFPFIATQMVLIATTTTTKCGKFRATFFRGCKKSDTPDLYFKVKQQILPPTFFPKTTIYAPTPVYCHTHWNYQCGTQEVRLYVTNPIARACPPCPPINAPLNWVLFMAIGNHPLSLIRGTSSTLFSITDT